MTTIRSVSELRLRLRELGYRPVPVLSSSATHPRRGKGTLLGDWTNACRDASPADIASWASLPAPHGNTGLLCDDLSAWDVDCDDPRLVHDIRGTIGEILGPPCMVRLSRGSRLLMPYGADAPRPTGGTRTFVKDGAEARVQVLGTGAQVVVNGTHPSGERYRFEDPERAPWRIARAELPVVTADRAAACVEALEAVIRAHGYSPAAPSQAAPHAPAKAPYKAKSGGGRTNFIFEVNRVAVESLDAISRWAPVLFPGGRWASGSWRVPSSELGRDLVEDLAIRVGAVKDFGLADMGDPDEGRRTPCRILVEHGIAEHPVDAAREICRLMGIEPVSLGYLPARTAPFARRAAQ